MRFDLVDSLAAYLNALPDRDWQEHYPKTIDDYTKFLERQPAAQSMICDRWWALYHLMMCGPRSAAQYARDYRDDLRRRGIDEEEGGIRIVVMQTVASIAQEMGLVEWNLDDFENVPPPEC